VEEKNYKKAKITDMLISIGKQSDGKDLQKKDVSLERKSAEVMNDDSAWRVNGTDGRSATYKTR